MNMDAGAAIKFLWGYDPVTKNSDRDIKIQFSGFEILPTTPAQRIRRRFRSMRK